MENYADMMFRGKVADLQKDEGSHDKYMAVYPQRTQQHLGPDETRFIQSRESFYIASVSQDGWPYVQHRGGPMGFLRAINPNKLACLDYIGNRQFITMGHVAEDPRVSLFLMDYMNRARLKIQGRASLLSLDDADQEIVSQFSREGVPAQRLLVIDVVALDWNCPKYIPALIPVRVANEATDSYTLELQKEVAKLKAELELVKSQK
ncbi:pyridoxamine 5'-phosphate oxidase family protein [Gelidibacter sp. F2691]|nr:pyridoxamine 5'-phosphate oxidase family protein [Gelidibacter sp. F2691]